MSGYPRRFVQTLRLSSPLTSLSIAHADSSPRQLDTRPKQAALGVVSFNPSPPPPSQSSNGRLRYFRSRISHGLRIRVLHARAPSFLESTSPHAGGEPGT